MEKRLTVHDLAAEYFTAKRTEMKKLFQDNGLVLDVMNEVGKYFTNDLCPYRCYYFQPFVKEDYMYRINEFLTKTFSDEFLSLYLPESKVIYQYNSKFETFGGCTHYGVRIIGHKDYLVVYVYKINTWPSFLHYDDYIDILNKYSIVCHYSEVNPENFISYLQSEGVDISSTMRSASRYYLDDIRAKLANYYKKKNFPV
jgi:hypothetical protein